MFSTSLAGRALAGMRKRCSAKFSLLTGVRLIAIMLGRLEMDVDECIAEYNELSETVFGEKAHLLKFNWNGKIQARFDTATLEGAIKKVLKHRNIPEDTLLNDNTEERGCKVDVMCTPETLNETNLRTGSSVVWRKRRRESPG
jgi:hypothetical protein